MYLLVCESLHNALSFVQDNGQAFYLSILGLLLPWLVIVIVKYERIARQYRNRE